MFEKEVKNKDGVVKRVVASSEAELKEAVDAVKAESAPVSLDINNPKDANKIVTPEDVQQTPPNYTPEAPKKVRAPKKETPKKEGRVKAAVKKILKK